MNWVPGMQGNKALRAKQVAAKAIHAAVFGEARVATPADSKIHEITPTFMSQKLKQEHVTVSCP
jgi:hypothetical protein